ERAVRELDRVERCGLTPAELHTRLSETVRHFLAERFELPAPQQTTGELLADQVDKVPLQAREALADFLRRTDIAKFAPLTPAARACREAIELGRVIVETCRESAEDVASMKMPPQRR